jgi:hypothetical protein
LSIKAVGPSGIRPAAIKLDSTADVKITECIMFQIGYQDFVTGMRIIDITKNNFTMPDHQREEVPAYAKLNVVYLYRTTAVTITKNLFQGSQNQVHSSQMVYIQEFAENTIVENNEDFAIFGNYFVSGIYAFSALNDLDVTKTRCSFPDRVEELPNTV